MHVTPLVWWVTVLVTSAILLVDVLVIGRRPPEPSRRETTLALTLFVGLAIGFRPHASAAAFAAALGVLLLFVAAVSWLAAAFGLLVRAPEAANSATFFLMFFCYASSAFVPVHTMPTSVGSDPRIFPSKLMVIPVAPSPK